MAKTKDRLMLEEILNKAAEYGLYQDVCNEGKEALKKLANHLNKPLSFICGDPVCKRLFIYTNEFEIPDLFEDEDSETEAEDILSVELVIKKNNKKLQVDVSEFYWN